VPAPVFTHARPPAPQPAKKPRREYKKCCDEQIISEVDSEVLCYTCGTVLASNTIVSEITFGETAGGAAMVEGGFIGENQRHANSMGGTMRGLGGMASREQAELQGRQEIEKIGGSLKLRQTVIEQAMKWYKLAGNHQFIQGRRMRNIAAVALYMAARRQPENTVMLMDLAEKIQVNVWDLGSDYKEFLKKLGEVDPAQLVGNKAVQEIEPLMLKYCLKLEFHTAAFKVADDACKLLKRMSRDWMVQGRQPAGLCGACIILAARMNNFRRTVREVVYVVKVADTTINHRLYEFRQTPSSVLTVNQFREFGNKLKVKTLPPAIWRREQKEERMEKRKAAAIAAGLDVANLELSGQSDTEAGPSNATSLPPRASKRRRRINGASQDIVPPAAATGPETLEVDAEINLDIIAQAFNTGSQPDDDAFVLPKKRGRPPKKRAPIVITQEDLEIEQEIESELTHTIKDWEAVFKEFQTNEEHPLFKTSGWTARQMTRAQLDLRDAPPVNTSPDIDDDPDVANCLLGPEEVRIKERIWITENEEWLRAQQKKILEAELDVALDLPKKPKQTRRHHQMGDGSVLEGQPATSAADAAHRMLKKRNKQFSNHINYDRLKELFPGGDMSASPSGSGSGQAASPAASQVTRTPPVIEVHDEDAEGEEDEEYEAQQYGEEEEDETQYLEDEDEGFGNIDDDGY
jgi:transcription factor IIIB subunit 2